VRQSDGGVKDFESKGGRAEGFGGAAKGPRELRKWKRELL